MKYIALDIGDKWTGVAISDSLGMFARPLETVQTEQLATFIQKIISSEPITGIIVGYPKTMRGTESEQTKKIIAQADSLKSQFPNLAWILWDERRTSKAAVALKSPKNKEEKLQVHARAAAIILQSYLDYLDFQKNQES